MQLSPIPPNPDLKNILEFLLTAGTFVMSLSGNEFYVTVNSARAFLRSEKWSENAFSRLALPENTVVYSIHPLRSQQSGINDLWDHRSMNILGLL
jgi:hypothetical protein